MNKKFAIGIPTLNRRDLLEEALEKYLVDFPGTDIYLLDNGQQDLHHWTHPGESERLVQLITCMSNRGVAGSWNELCNWIFHHGHENALILNDDIYWGKNEGQVLTYLSGNPGSSFYGSTKNWCLYLLPKKTFTLVGKFDETFYPAYFEDSDYAYRMKLANCSQLYDTFFDPILYRNSMTLQKDRSINDKFMDNQNYFIKKWGGEPGKEMFSTPFDR